jgi:hypothetical protein
MTINIKQKNFSTIPPKHYENRYWLRCLSDIRKHFVNCLSEFINMTVSIEKVFND